MTLGGHVQSSRHYQENEGERIERPQEGYVMMVPKNIQSGV